MKPATLGDSENPVDWLAKDVCVDASNRLLAMDAFYECPSGSNRRKIQPGDPIPYHNLDQGSYQMGDSYPVYDSSYNTLYIETFDWSPMTRFNLYDGSDGYDYYSTNKGWVSGAGTRDGGGYGTTWFGGDCQPDTGWIFFPTSGFLSAGQAQLPITGDYWEQSFNSFPGTCRGNFGYPVTKWEPVKNFPFGGVNGNRVKPMDTIISYHGFEPGNPTAGMEVTYYTQQYGRARWEAWRHVSTNPTKTSNCNVPDTIDYMGQKFVVVDCRDWTQVRASTVSEIPEWPLAPANLLQHFHFDDGGFTGGQDWGQWHRGGNSAEGNLINWSLFPDGGHPLTSPFDYRFGPGVRYLATNCGGTCTGAGVQQIYQEIPISSFRNGMNYLYGVDARTESGVGRLHIELQEIAGDGGPVVWSDSFEATVDAYAGTNSDANFIRSVYTSMDFIHKQTRIPIQPGATKIRFIITPITSETFFILDSWLNPFPAVNSALNY